MTAVPAIAPRIRDRVVVWVFLLGFLVPMMVRSTTKHQVRFVGEAAKLHDIACLFTTKPQAWNSYYVQVLFPGQRSWTTLDQSEFFGMQPFGRRTRMHRFLIAWGRKPKDARTRDLARWILERWEASHPDAAKPLGIRFALAWTVPQVDDPPQTGWRQLDWLYVRKNQTRIIATYEREELLDP